MTDINELDVAAENTEAEPNANGTPPTAILFAGVNGAGKTSLYEVMKILGKERVLARVSK